MAELGLRENEQKPEKVMNHSANKEDRFEHQTSGQSIEQDTEKGICSDLEELWRTCF